jgi:hypothetical protein
MAEITRIVFFHNRAAFPVYPISRACVLMGFRFTQVPAFKEDAVKLLEKDDLALVHVEEGDSEGLRFFNNLPDHVAKHVYRPSTEDHSVDGRKAELSAIFGGCQPAPVNV